MNDDIQLLSQTDIDELSSQDVKRLSQTDIDELNGWFNYCENLCYEDMCSKQFDQVGCYIMDENQFV